MKTFKYDALLKCDKAKYQSSVLEEIRQDYEKMLAAGATSVWETTDGASEFDNAGSLPRMERDFDCVFRNIIAVAK